MKVKICSASGQAPSEHCPIELIEQRVYLSKSEGSTKTADTPYILPKDFEKKVCEVHVHGINIFDPPENPDEPEDIENAPEVPDEGEPVPPPELPPIENEDASPPNILDELPGHRPEGR